MNIKSRTAKSARNSFIALGVYLINLLLQFFSRRVFFEYLGADVLGLNTTATNLLQFLNLAELGIGTAIAYTLYKPLYENDKEKINEIISLQGWLYRRIAYLVIGGSFILMFFFPLIFAKIKLPLWYAYGSFSALLISSLLGYFVNYRQILLSADQKEYKIEIGYKLVLSAKVFFQIIAIKYFTDGYIWWLGLEVVFAFLASTSLNLVIKKEYPHLRAKICAGKSLSKKYVELTTKVKQLFFHRIGSFVLTQTSPLIIYAYTTLAVVAIFGNYALIITGCTTLMTAVFNGMNASVGSLVSQGDKKKILSVFQEFFSIRFYLTAAICYGVYVVAPSFITIWVGKEYILDDSCLLILIGSMFIRLMKSTIEAFTNAYGLFSDIWAPIAEAIINIGMSIFLGYFYGLAGILTGVLISLVAIIFLWKPIFLFWKGFKIRMTHYWSSYFLHVLAMSFSILINHLLVEYFGFERCSFSDALLQVVMFCALLLVGQYSLCKGLRMFISRLKQIAKKHTI